MNHHPPRFSVWLLDYFSRQGAMLNYTGDFEEAFYAISEEQDIKAARKWYRNQVIRSLPSLIIDSIYWSSAMFKNYIKTSFRNIKKTQNLHNSKYIRSVHRPGLCAPAGNLY